MTGITMTQSNAVLFKKTIEVRWADCDANNHMRHSAYSDFCGHTRVCYLESIGLTSDWFKQHNVGPVLFKEETEYKREAHLNEQLTVTLETGEPTGFTKSIQMVQHMYKQNGELAAIHKCVVAWMDLEKRKIIELPERIRAEFSLAQP
jgi:acyl-CoA thioester hydrolase